MSKWKCPKCGEDLPSIQVGSNLRSQSFRLIAYFLFLVSIFWLIPKSLEGKKFDSSSKLKILSHEVRRNGSRVEIIGQLQNGDTVAWKSVNIEAEFFDAAGKFIDECSEKLYDGIAPSAVKNFKISCSSCNGSAVPDFSTYKVEITDASTRY